MLLKQNGTRKEHWKFFLLEISALLLQPKSPFGQNLHRVATNHLVEEDFIPVKNRQSRQKTSNMMINKTKNRAGEQLRKVQDKKLADLSRKFPELIPEESLTNAHLSVKNLFTEKIPNCN